MKPNSQRFYLLILGVLLSSCVYSNQESPSATQTYISREQDRLVLVRYNPCSCVVMKGNYNLDLEILMISEEELSQHILKGSSNLKINSMLPNSNVELQKLSITDHLELVKHVLSSISGKRQWERIALFIPKSEVLSNDGAVDIPKFNDKSILLLNWWQQHPEDSLILKVALLDVGRMLNQHHLRKGQLLSIWGESEFD